MKDLLGTEAAQFVGGDMQTFARKQNQPQEPVSSSLARSNIVKSAPDYDRHPIQQLQRGIGNQAMQRMLQNHVGEPEARSTVAISPRLGRDFSRIPIHAPAAGVDLSIVRRAYQPTEGAVLRRCGGRQCAPGACDHDEETPVRCSAIGSAFTAAMAPSMVREVLESAGSPLDAGVRAFMEPRFGHDFSRVRVHTDQRAGASCNAVNALAYTVGHDIAFAAGAYSPGTAEGRRLLAHELTHVVQRRDAGRSVSAARLTVGAANDLAEHEADQIAARVLAGNSAPSAGLVPSTPVVRRSCGPTAIGVVGGCTARPDEPSGQRFLFNVACDEFAPGEEARLRAFAHTISGTTSVTIDGFASEEGNPGFNENLSCARALKTATVLKSEGIAESRITGKFMHGATPGPRPQRRSAVITTTAAPTPTPTSTPTPVPVPAPTPTPTPATTVPTTDCTQPEAEALARARPIATSMVDKAISMLGLNPADSRTPQVKALLRKYFGDDSASTYLHALTGFRAIQRGLAQGVTYECEHRGSFMYNWFCGGSTLGYTRWHGVAMNIHLCEAGFTRGDVDLATTMVHENSHMFDATGDPQYCDQSAGCTLDRWSAYDNADSYAIFAQDVYQNM